MHYSLEYNLQKYVLIVTSENDCISVTLQRINLEPSKAVTSETLFISKKKELLKKSCSGKSCFRYNCILRMKYRSFSEKRDLESIILIF